MINKNAGLFFLNIHESTAINLKNVHTHGRARTHTGFTSNLEVAYEKRIRNAKTASGKVSNY